MRRIAISLFVLCAALFGAWQLSPIDLPHFKSAQAACTLPLCGAGPSGPVVSGGSATCTAEDVSQVPAGAETGGSYTWPSVTFNTGSNDVAVVAITNAASGNASTINSVTVNSISFTMLSGQTNDGEQGVLAYGKPGTLTTSSVVIGWTGAGNIFPMLATAKVVTTTPSPYSTGSHGATSSESSPLAFGPTSGSGGIPANGCAVGVIGDFFTSGTRVLSSIAPTQYLIYGDTGGNGQNFGFGASASAGSTSGLTATNAAAASFFEGWAIASWSP
jgi:hypothetical protein